MILVGTAALFIVEAFILATAKAFRLAEALRLAEAFRFAEALTLLRLVVPRHIDCSLSDQVTVAIEQCVTNFGIHFSGILELLVNQFTLGEYRTAA